MRNDKLDNHEGQHTEQGKRARWGAVAVLALSLTLAGCLEGGGPGDSFKMQILEPGETPETVEDCEFRVRPFSEEDLLEGEWGDEDWSDEDWSDEDWDDEEFEVPEPEEWGYQFLGTRGAEYCEDGEFMVALFYARYAEEDFDTVVKDYKQQMDQDEQYEDWENEFDGEYGEEWDSYDACSFTVAMWGDDQVVSAIAMDPGLFTGDYDFSQDETPDAQVSPMENVTQALENKFPGMDSVC